MAPINNNNLARRGIGNGNIFSIVFATVALVLLAICFVWACLWPWLRMKYINDRFPVQVRSTDGDHLTRRRRESRLGRMMFDSPRNSRVSSKQDPTELRTYNPHSETPFPNQPQPSEAVSLPYLTPRTQSTTDLGPATTTHSFLTPTKTQHSAHCSPLDASVTASGSNIRQAPPKSASSDKKFGDAKDYILALPKPIALIPRSVGETPTPSKNLPGLPVSRSVSSDKHLHPNKLFKTLTTESHYINRYNDTQPVSQEGCQHSRQPTNCANYREVEEHDSQYETEEEGSEQATASKEVSDVPSIADMSQISTEEDSDNHNPSLAAIHRLRTYRSLTGAVDPRGLTRSGTVTRSKTPVAEIRDLFDRTVSESRRPGQALSRENTFATEPAVLNSSEKGRSSSTHATSTDFSASSLSLLPTPLRIRAGSFGEDVPPVPMTYSIQGIPVDTPADHEPTARDVLTAFKAKTMIRKPETANTFSTRLRPVPAPLELSKLRQPKTRFPQLREVSSASSIVAPLVTHNKGSPSTFRGSSVYSRDTKGASIARTPITPNFVGSTGRTPVSPYFPGSDKTGLTNRKPSSPADMVQTKVDNWHYHVGADLSHSDLNGPGPELRTSQRFSQDASVISTEYNPAEEAWGRMSIPRVQVNKDEVIPPMPDHSAVSTSQIIRQVTSDSALVVAARGHAPGGAGWV